MVEFYGADAGMNALIQPNQFIQLTITREINGETNIYLNQELQVNFMDSTGLGIISNNNLLHFFVDDFNTDTEQSGGTVARITVYDTALSSTEVSELELLDVIFNDNFESQQ